MNNDRTSTPNIPPYTWKRPIGLGWENPYTVRYASNLDDGPGTECLWAGSVPAASAIARDFNLWHIDGASTFFAVCPLVSSAFLKKLKARNKLLHCPLNRLPMAVYRVGNGIQKKEQGRRKQEEEKSLIPGLIMLCIRAVGLFTENVFEAQLSCEQFSPILPNNYQESSYPVAMFEWVAHNPTDAPITLSIMLTWENIVGWFTNANKSPKVMVRDDGSPFYDYQPRWGESAGNLNLLVEDFHRIGCVMTRLTADDEPQEGEGQWAIATITNPAVEVFYQTRWNPAGNGDDIWRNFSAEGFLLDDKDETAAAAGEQLACAIAVRFTIRSGKTRKIPFIIAWDLPVTEFASGVWYYRRYTDFFCRNGKNAWPIIRTAMKHSDTWRENIRSLAKTDFRTERFVRQF